MANSIISNALTYRNGVKPRLRKVWVRHYDEFDNLQEISYEWVVVNAKDMSFAEMVEAIFYANHFNELLKRYQTGETWI
jgi:hypothetical protein